ncbi:hypothetical protein Ddye_011537, partial [Dipteronia dyeriana]
QIVGSPFPPPYLGLSEAENKTLLVGVNYGSGGCGILSTSQNYLHINYFETTIINLERRFESKRCFDNYLSKSLLFIDIGNIDMSSGYNGVGATIFVNTQFHNMHK